METVKTGGSEISLESLEDTFMMDLCVFVNDVGKWADKNFGESLVHQPLLGMIEEVGELYDAFISNPKTGEIDYPKMVDAVGDTMVFLAHYCYRNDIDLKFCLGKALVELGLDVGKMVDNGGELAADKSRSFLGLQQVYALSVEKFPKNHLRSNEHTFGFLLTYSALSVLSHNHLKMEQGIRGSMLEHKEKQISDLSEFLIAFCGLVSILGIHLENAVVDTWSVVKNRDWSKNKTDGIV